MPGVLHPGNRRTEKPVESCGGGGLYSATLHTGARLGNGFAKPARTDTTYFHDYIYGRAEIRFVRGRLRFTDEEGKAYTAAPFPSMVVIYNGNKEVQE